MGTGRSGSTVLQGLLANATSARGLGEVTHILKDGMLRNRRCTCGEDFADCPTWSGLHKPFPDQETLAHALRLRDRFETHGSLFFQIAHLIPAGEWGVYRVMTAAIFEAVRGSGEILIDSSKYAARAHALRTVHGPAIRIIWMTRSPRGLLESFSTQTKGEQPPKGPLRTLLYYVVVTFWARVVTWRFRGEVLKVRYEDLLANPVAELNRVGHWCGLDMRPVIDAVEANRPLPLGHVITGNRLRKRGTFRLGVPRPTSPPAGLRASLALHLMKTWRRLVGA
jgi:hypothetical protein